MNTNMKELNINEMEQANGGIIPILLGFGTIAVGGALFSVFYNDVKKKKKNA